MFCSLRFDSSGCPDIIEESCSLSALSNLRFVVSYYAPPFPEFLVIVWASKAAGFQCELFRFQVAAIIFEAPNASPI